MHESYTKSHMTSRLRGTREMKIVTIVKTSESYEDGSIVLEVPVGSLLATFLEEEDTFNISSDFIGYVKLKAISAKKHYFPSWRESIEWDIYSSFKDLGRSSDVLRQRRVIPKPTPHRTSTPYIIEEEL